MMHNLRNAKVTQGDVTDHGTSELLRNVPFQIAHVLKCAWCSDMKALLPSESQLLSLLGIQSSSSMHFLCPLKMWACFYSL